MYTACYQQIRWARSHLSLSMKLDRTVLHRLPSRAYLQIRPASQHQIMTWAPKCRATGRGKGPRSPFCISIRGNDTISPARVLTIIQRAVLHHHTIQCGKYADRHHASWTGRPGFPINPFSLAPFRSRNSPGMTGVNNISCLIDKTNESFRFAPFVSQNAGSITCLSLLLHCTSYSTVLKILWRFSSFVRFVREAPARSTDVSI